MQQPQNLIFTDQSAFDTRFGAPLVEIVLRVEPGPCTLCGALPTEGSAGILNDAYVENGVMRGDAICSDCLDRMGDSVMDDAFLAL